MSELNLTEIKARPEEKTEIRYHDEKSVGGNGEYLTVRSSDLPRPELYNAMNSLVPFICETVGFPESYGTGMEIVGVKVRKRDEGDSLIIKFAKTIDEEEGIEWAPKVPQTSVETTEVQEIVDRIRGEADLYLSGKRAQEELALQV